MREWEECLDITGGVDAEGPEALLAYPTPPCRPGASLDYISALCLLRAQVYDSMENFPRSVQWYKAALMRDPFNYGAFQALVEKHKLTVEEEATLISEVSGRLPPEQRWLGLLYQSKCKQYDDMGVEAGLSAIILLEGEPSVGGHTGNINNNGGGGATAAETPIPPTQQQQHSMQSTPSTGGGGHDVSMSGVTPEATQFPPPEIAGSLQRPGSTIAGNQKRASGASAMAISPISEGSEGGPGVRMGTHTPSTSTRSPSGAAESGGGVYLSASTGPPAGWGLGANADVVASHAELLLRRGRFHDAFAMTSSVLDRDPYADAVLPPHLSAALSLGKKHELFALGHRLMKAQPDKSVSWYASGCYYLLTGQYTSARQYFAKATALDRSFAPAWMGFGQAFAAQDETDQAMAAFRSAARLFPGLHLPLLGMALEYLRMNNVVLAEQMMLRAYRRCPVDAAVSHELGTLAFRQGQYNEAVQWLTKALEGMPREYPGLWEPTMVNLGHALRKLRRFDDAIDMFTRALGAAPEQPGTLAALAYTHHLVGNLNLAIENYHKALGLRPNDDFSSSMLSVAVDEEAEVMTNALTKGLEPWA